MRQLLGMAAVILALSLPLPLSATTDGGYPVEADTLSILFRLDSINIDMGFASNAAHWQAFEDRFLHDFQNVNPNSLRLDIYSGASPEGTPEHNRWLGENRGLAVRRLVRQRIGDRVGTIVVHNEAARWDGLYDLVARSNEPWRDEVLRIIEQPASEAPNQRDHREVQLRRLNDGTVWPVLLRDYLAPLRSGATAVLTWQAARDTVVVVDTVMVTPGPGAPYQPGGYAVVYPGIYPGYGEVGAVLDPNQLTALDSLLLDRLSYPAWAVKTNLLFWGVAAPNIEVEIPLGRDNKWSLEMEYIAPWFVWGHNAHASQLQNLGFELRRYLGHREYHRWLQGWHVGIAVAAGYYDWEWKRSKGYQGEYINTYCNLGYQMRWGTNWALDASLGFGLFATKYRHYYGSSTYPDGHEEAWDRHLMYRDSGRQLWPGLCHAAIQLSYMFNAWPFYTKPRRLDE